MNVASVKTAPIKGLEMDSEQEVVLGHNNGLHWVNALMFLKMWLSGSIFPGLGRGKQLDLVGIKTLQAREQLERERARQGG